MLRKQKLKKWVRGWDPRDPVRGNGGKMGCELGDEAEGPEGLALSQCFPQGARLPVASRNVPVGPHCEGCCSFKCCQEVGS